MGPGRPFGTDFDKATAAGVRIHRLETGATGGRSAPCCVIPTRNRMARSVAVPFEGRAGVAPADALLRRGRSPSRPLLARLLAVFVALGASGAAGLAGEPPAGGAPQPAATEAPASAPVATPEVLAARQRAVRERMARLENRMLELSRLLAETEPEKAERLRDTLEQVGRRQLRTRLEKLSALLEGEQLSEADREQGAVLRDLSSLMELLTSSLNELDRLRERRKQLEALKKQVAELLDEQRRVLYRTQQVGKALQRQVGPAEPAPRHAGESESPPEEQMRQQIRRLEELQNELQRRAGQLQAAMKQQPSGAAEPTPGQDQMQAARENMQQATDELGQQSPQSAQEPQKKALDAMQQAVDRLEQNLRQMREDEREQTLAALETRLQGLLSQEKRVRESVGDLLERDAAAWGRVEDLQVAEAGTLHNEARQQAEATLRILVDEGTTVVVPEMLRQIVEDMGAVSGDLATDGGAGLSEAAARLDDIIGQLEEILAAVGRQRDADAEAQQPKQQQQGQQGTRPLLARSAELKLLRSAQVRINRRTAALAEAADGRAIAAAARRLAERQKRLADQAARMYESK